MAIITLEKKFWTFLENFSFQTKIVWLNAVGIITLNVLSFYALFFVIFKAKLYTWIWTTSVVFLSALGVTAGAHRLWTHKSYKAKLPLRIFFMLSYMTSGEYSLVQWAWDHRLHHKYSDTNADPHNANRGFFFSHCGWLMMKRHPEVKSKGKTIDLSDLWEDPVVVFQQKYFVPMLIILFIILPSVIPYYFWNEQLKVVILGVFIFRYGFTLNVTWAVNSVAHFFGQKPYNKNIRPAQNKYVALLTFGEGWHNYHHVFPWDYRTSEFLTKPNISCLFIDFCAKLGLAYDLKAATPELIERVMQKTGDKVPGTIKMDEKLSLEELSNTLLEL